ncbi:Subtilase family protein, putative [Theobroma cacao]|uniref:Subtilase family protein, putative n=1 Tax=Theobroma cacao TaxID=3641 RepID=A0A061GWP2_THECC|nr:Subtilase family protein, putative [Theobroma cacao]
MDKSKNPDGEIAYGAGHINPVKAIHPGLVYEAFKEDYIKLMCSLGYSPDNVKLVSGGNSSCPKRSENVPPKDLNYPSPTASVPTNKSFTVTFHRTVENVGLANSTYKAEVSPNPKLEVKVVPEILSFKALNETKSFKVTVSGGDLKSHSLLSTTLIWSDGTHIVRSPIVVHT